MKDERKKNKFVEPFQFFDFHAAAASQDCMIRLSKKEEENFIRYSIMWCAPLFFLKSTWCETLFLTEFITIVTQSQFAISHTLQSLMLTFMHFIWLCIHKLQLLDFHIFCWEKYIHPTLIFSFSLFTNKAHKSSRTTRTAMIIAFLTLNDSILRSHNDLFSIT